MESNPKCILMNLHGIGTQASLDNILQNHGRLRDQYCCHTSLESDYVINAILLNIVASYFNASLITFGHPLVGSEMTPPCPVIYPVVQVFGGVFSTDFVVGNFIITNNISKVIEYPRFVKSEQGVYNFGYCAQPRKKWDSAWDFRIFADPFDIWTWILLGCFFILVSIFVWQLTSHGFSIIFLASFSSLLGNELSLGIRSKLYLVWLFTTLHVLNLYSGAITSHVIAQPSELQFTKLAELEQENYIMIFPRPGYQMAVKKSVREILNTKFVEDGISIVSRLLKKSRVYNYLNLEFSKALTELDRLAALLWWPHALFSVASGNEYILKINSNEEIRRKKCYIGKDNINLGENFLAFTPPGSDSMATMYERLLASGIEHRWRQEHFGLLMATRVQDRARVKSRTSFVKEEATTGKLKLEGKILTIFLLWIFCLIICSTAFGCEMFTNCAKCITCSRIARTKVEIIFP